MNESKLLLVSIFDHFTITNELIQSDLILQSYFHDSDAKDWEIEKMIRLKVQDSIFKLIIIKNETILSEAEEWYFQKIKESYSIELVTNPNALKKKAGEILQGLDRFRLRSIAK